jgi:hypothetical protein
MIDDWSDVDRKRHNEKNDVKTRTHCQSLTLWQQDGELSGGIILFLLTNHKTKIHDGCDFSICPGDGYGSTLRRRLCAII